MSIKPAPLSSEFLTYLARAAATAPEAMRLPTLTGIAAELGISVASLREQVEVAKALGLVEAKPRTGLHRRPYSFLPAVRESLAFATELDPALFEAYADLRKNVEAAYWNQAVRLLTPADHLEMQALVKQAWERLRGPNIQIPHAEHRNLHLLIYHRLSNPFVIGLLEAYWEAYEAVGYSVYADYAYLSSVWTYHERMVTAICQGDYEAGYAAQLEHTELIHHRPPPVDTPASPDAPAPDAPASFDAPALDAPSTDGRVHTNGPASMPDQPSSSNPGVVGRK